MLCEQLVGGISTKQHGDTVIQTPTDKHDGNMFSSKVLQSNTLLWVKSMLRILHQWQEIIGNDCLKQYKSFKKHNIEYFSETQPGNVH